MQHESPIPTECPPDTRREAELFDELSAALEEERKVIEAIRKVFAETPDRAEAERLVMREYATTLDEALQRAQNALERWLTSMR